MTEKQAANHEKTNRILASVSESLKTIEPVSGVVVYTAIFGFTDPLVEPRHVEGARFICFTDQPIGSVRWEMVRVPAQEAPTRASRVVKLNPHRIFPDVEASLWMDASFGLLVPVRTLLDKHPQPVVSFLHNERSRIAEEAEEIIRVKRGIPEEIHKQLETYQLAGFDTDDNRMTGLSSNGVLLRRHTPEVAALNEQWTREIEAHTLRDQMSLDYVAWKQKMPLGRWEGSHRESREFKFHHHKRPVNDY